MTLDDHNISSCRFASCNTSFASDRDGDGGDQALKIQRSGTSPVMEGEEAEGNQKIRVSAAVTSEMIEDPVAKSLSDSRRDSSGSSHEELVRDANASLPELLRACSRHPRRQADAVLPALSRLLDLQARLTAARAPLGGAPRAEGETERVEGTEGAEESAGGGGGRGEAGREGGGGAAAEETSLVAAPAAPPELSPWQQLEEQLSLDEPGKSLASETGQTSQTGQTELASQASQTAEGSLQEIQTLLSRIDAPLSHALDLLEQEFTTVLSNSNRKLNLHILKAALHMQNLAILPSPRTRGGGGAGAGAGGSAAGFGAGAGGNRRGGSFSVTGNLFSKGLGGDGGEGSGGGKYTPSGARPPPSPSSPANKQHGRAASQFLFDDPMLIEYNASLSARASSPLGSGRASGTGSEGGVAGGGGSVGTSGGPGPSLLSPMGGGTGSSLLSPVGCSTPQSTLSDAVLTATASSSTNTSSSSIAAVSGPLETLFIGSDVAGAVGAAGAAAAVDGVSSIGVVEGGGGVMKSRSATQPTLQCSSSFPVQQNKLGIVSSNSLSLPRSAAASAVGDGDSTAPPPRITIPPVYSDGGRVGEWASGGVGEQESRAVGEWAEWLPVAEVPWLSDKARQATVASAVESVSMKEYTAEETQAMAWADLEPLIKLWIRDISILLRVLFISEHQLISGVGSSTPLQPIPFLTFPSFPPTPYPTRFPCPPCSPPPAARSLHFRASTHQWGGILDASPTPSPPSPSLTSPLRALPWPSCPPPYPCVSHASPHQLRALKANDSTTHSTSQSTPENTPEGAPESPPENPPESTPESSSKRTEQVARKPGEHLMSPDSVFRHLVGSVGGVKSTLCALCANAAAIAASKSAPEKIFALLEAYRTVADLSPQALPVFLALRKSDSDDPIQALAAPASHIPCLSLLFCPFSLSTPLKQALPVFLARPKSDSDDPFKLWQCLSQLLFPPPFFPLFPPPHLPFFPGSGPASVPRSPQERFRRSLQALAVPLAAPALPVFLALPKSDSDDPFKLWQRLSQLFAGAIFATLDDLNRILRDVAAFVPANQASGSSPMKKKLLSLSQLFARALFSQEEEANKASGNSPMKKKLLRLSLSLAARERGGGVRAGQPGLGSSPMKKKLLRLIHWKSSEQKTTNDEEVDIGVHKCCNEDEGCTEAAGLSPSAPISSPRFALFFPLPPASVATRMKDALKQQDRIAAYEAAFDKAGLAKQDRIAAYEAAFDKAGLAKVSAFDKAGLAKVSAFDKAGLAKIMGQSWIKALMACLASEEVSAKLSADAVTSLMACLAPEEVSAKLSADAVTSLMACLAPEEVSAKLSADAVTSLMACLAPEEVSAKLSADAVTSLMACLAPEEVSAKLSADAVTSLMACLAPEEVSAKLSADAVKSRLKKFNSAFEEVALEQNRWIVISDSQRKKTRIRFARTLKNAYLEFLTPHREIISDITTYQWSPDGIERLMLKSFFLGRSLPLIMTA
ncbi:unnamed protein product [Closterium sp. NIES-65]|nr:unnamed protein product [Closterium sp. NIES-65]